MEEEGEDDKVEGQAEDVEIKSEGGSEGGDQEKNSFISMYFQGTKPGFE